MGSWDLDESVLQFVVSVVAALKGRVEARRLGRPQLLPGRHPLVGQRVRSRSRRGKTEGRLLAWRLQPRRRRRRHSFRAGAVPGRAHPGLGHRRRRSARQLMRGHGCARGGRQLVRVRRIRVRCWERRKGFSGPSWPRRNRLRRGRIRVDKLLDPLGRPHVGDTGTSVGRAPQALLRVSLRTWLRAWFWAWLLAWLRAWIWVPLRGQLRRRHCRRRVRRRRGGPCSCVLGLALERLHPGSEGRRALCHLGGGLGGGGGNGLARGALGG
mmetsp:Transcript_25160/g.56588  ORF Transcript_25160/g.56588 Transcript_25160/m.56588 type:complete len:268 (+) Transcript_25160:303-1106(+)